MVLWSSNKSLEKSRRARLINNGVTCTEKYHRMVLGGLWNTDKGLMLWSAVKSVMCVYEREHKHIP